MVSVSISGILIATAIVGGIGLFIGLFLGGSAILFKVEVKMCIRDSSSTGSFDFYLAGKGRQQAARAQGHGFESDGGNQ